MKIKNNIMLAFYLLLFLGFILLGIVSNIKYKDMKDKLYTKNNHITQVIAQSTNFMLNQYGVMLDILGEQLIENNNYKNKEKTTLLFDRLLKKNPSLAGFGLIDLKGNFVSVSSNINMSKIKNLLENEITRASFLKTLESKHTVIGRTYYVEGIGEWVIPLRQTIYDESGTPIGVITAGLKIGKDGGLFSKVALSEEIIIVIINDKDNLGKFYRMYYHSNTNNDKNKLYNSPLVNEVSIKVQDSVYKRYKMTLKEVMSSSRLINIIIKDSWGELNFASLVYDNKYKVWVIIQSPKSLLTNAFINIFLIYIIIFAQSYLILFALFKYISDNEKKKSEELIFEASHDFLTKLPNRNYIKLYIDKWIKGFSNEFEILFIDLDNFKNINDGFGHKIGDEILIEVASRYLAFLDDDTLLVRHGGDEFIVLIPKTEESEKKLLMEELLKIISHPYEINGLEFHLGSSIGTAQYPKDSSNFEELVSLSDIAMYEAKKTKNSYCIFSSKMKEKSLFNGKLESHLRYALEKDEIWMVYQPQINSNGTLHGVEALVRWQNEKLGFVPPDVFIAIAEETGLMKSLGEFIITQSLNEINELLMKFNTSFQLSINISVRQLMEKDFLEHLLCQLESIKFDKNKVTLEITESLFIEDIEYILPLLQEVKDNGINLSLDDFGTGYSSLSMLRKLPINELKIDKSFVDEILNNDEDAALVGCIINLGHNLNMYTLAEGTETIEQVNKLKEYGCDIFQGYYFSKPLKKEDLKAYLTKIL